MQSPVISDLYPVIEKHVPPMECFLHPISRLYSHHFFARSRCSFFFRVSGKQPNSRLTLKPKCRSGTKRDGPAARKREGENKEADEEKDIEREAECLRVSLAIFQAVFLQDNGFNRDLIKIIQITRPAVNSIRKSFLGIASSFMVRSRATVHR